MSSQPAWTRRAWAVALATAPLVAAQTPTAATSPADVQKKADEELNAVKELLAKIDLPMDVAPAFQFRP
jgi:hypothetical protein